MSGTKAVEVNSSAVPGCVLGSLVTRGSAMPVVQPCRYTDFRLRAGNEGSKEGNLVVPSTKSSNKIISLGGSADGEPKKLFESPWSSSYTVSVPEGVVKLSLDNLLPAATAGVEGPEGGESPTRPRDPWASFKPGVAESLEEIWEWVDLEKEEKEKELKEKEFTEQEPEPEEGTGEAKVKAYGFVKGMKAMENEETKEKDLAQEKLLGPDAGKKELVAFVERQTLLQRKEEKGKKAEAEKSLEKELQSEMRLESEEGTDQEHVERENEKEGKVRRRKACSGFLSSSEKAWARARELNRSLLPLLFPGLRKRKYASFQCGTSLRVVEKANAERLKVEKKREEMKEKEMKKKEREVLKGKDVEAVSYYKSPPKVTVAPFIFGQKKDSEGVFIFGQKEDSEGVFIFGQKDEDSCSEILFRGGAVRQVREEFSYPEPGKISFLHRLQGGLQVASVLGGQSLGDWARQLLGDRVWEGVGGYFTTKGGKVLNSETPVNKLGLHGSQEVVLQGRLRGGGYSGGGKGVRGGGGNSVAAGDWTCGICNQSGCWNAKNTCYRCGAPRQQSQGLSGQASSGVWDMEGRYQGGVGTGMGGSRVIGPTGRDQSSIPGGNPTHRKGPQPGGKGRNKVGGDTGAGVGVGFGTGGGVVGGGGGGDNRSAFAWLGGGGGVGNPLPPGMVLSERDQYQICVDLLKGLLKDGEVEEYENFWNGRLPAKPVPAPVKTPTEAQRAEVFAQLTRKQDGLARRVKDGQGRVEAARAKVRQEEAALVELERELKGVSDQVDAHRAENLRRAEEAKAPRVDEVGSDMDLEAGSSSGGEFGVNQVAGKRRKVVRKNRFQGNKASKEEMWQFLNEMPDPDKDWLKRQFLGDVGSGVRCADHTLVGDVVELDKVELNARAPLAPTQEDVAETPCG